MNILDRIVVQKRLEIALLPQDPVTPFHLREAVRRRGGLRDFAGALRGTKPGRIGLIAEVKKASPSAGVICPDFDPIRIAQTYQRAGANCLSVLTDVLFFQGSLDYLRQIHGAVSLPLLRKDFIIDERQILEAVQAGADAILLIVSILNDDQLRHFHDLADSIGLAALVEVHDEEELERALRCGARLIGVNNRNLKIFQVDLATTERLGERLFRVDSSEKYLLVAESGIATRADVVRVQQAGAKAILVGESLMRSKDIEGQIRQLIGMDPSR